MSARSLNVSIDDARQREKYQTCVSKLAPIFDAIQTDDESSSKEAKKLKDKRMKQVDAVFEETGLKIFSETLIRMMIVPFSTKDSLYVTKVIQFFYDIVTDERWEVGDGSSPNDTVMSVTSNCSNMSVIEDGATEPLPVRILRLCERYHTETRALVRLRIMQTFDKIVPQRITPFEIRRGLQLRLTKMLLTRLRDKSDPVRAVAAVNLCAFLEEGLPYQGVVLDNLLTHMAFDPDPAVRAKIVSTIKITDETLEHVVERTGDPDNTVRTAAITRVTKDINLSSLTLEMREAILMANTTEENPKIVQKAVSLLLEHWLQCLKNDPCEFLRVLNVRKRHLLCKKVLDSVYNQPSEEAFEKMKEPLFKDKDKKYPDDSLSSENTFLWLYMYKRFKDDHYVFTKLALPVTEMIEYIKEYLEVVEDEGDLTNADLDYRSWMLGDLLLILQYLPCEEGGRQAVVQFVSTLFLNKKLMDVRNCVLGVKLISSCSNIQDETVVIDIVNSVLYTDRDSTRKSERRSLSSSGVSDSPTSLKIELGNLTHKRRKLEKDRDIAVRENDLYKAQACQDEINELETKIQNIKVRIDEASPDNSMTEETEEEEEEKWNYSDKTMLIAMSTVKTNILLSGRISTFSRTFYEMYVVKAVSKCSPVVRAIALEVMTLIAFEFEDEFPRASLFCLTALLKDQLIVKTQALKCLHDLIMRYSFARLAGWKLLLCKYLQLILGLSFFILGFYDNLLIYFCSYFCPETQEVKGILYGVNTIKDLPTFQTGGEDTTATLRSLLMSYIRHAEAKLVKVSVSGLLKLLFKHDLNTSRIITSFLMNWAIPTYELQLRFKEVSVMIPVYAMMGEDEAIEVAKCLFQCLKKIQAQIGSRGRDTPAKLPCSDASKIITLVVTCTDPSRLSKFQRPYIGHETIAITAVEELQNVELTSDEKTQYAKLLKSLNLSQCPKNSIKQLITSVSNIAESTNRTICGILNGFLQHLASLLPENESQMEDETQVAAGAFDDDDE
ncbi:Condensin complex subunit 3 [Orchesella cincta]|uniref:Condensin complex subunit 3 n=1 Tax=Orchesella cincta TaxID=48709 RepID=A0A1D2MVH0_ORCCI|nr:Condensin complex subunit 3 [Orchesella cincta]